MQDGWFKGLKVRPYNLVFLETGVNILLGFYTGTTTCTSLSSLPKQQESKNNCIKKCKSTCTATARFPIANNYSYVWDKNFILGFANIIFVYLFDNNWSILNTTYNSWNKKPKETKFMLTLTGFWLLKFEVSNWRWRLPCK